MEGRIDIFALTECFSLTQLCLEKREEEEESGMEGEGETECEETNFYVPFFHGSRECLYFEQPAGGGEVLAAEDRGRKKKKEASSCMLCLVVFPRL